MRYIVFAFGVDEQKMVFNRENGFHFPTNHTPVKPSLLDWSIWNIENRDVGKYH